MLTDAARRRLTDFRKRMMEDHFRRQIEQRPEVISRGKPVSGEAAHRGLAVARYLLGKAISSRKESPCPAALTLSHSPDTQVRCGIERTLLAERTDPQSMLSFCFGDYTACPSWRVQRESDWSGRRLPLVSASEGV